MLFWQRAKSILKSEWVSKVNGRVHEWAHCLVRLNFPVDRRTNHSTPWRDVYAAAYNQHRWWCALRWSENITVLTWPCTPAEQTSTFLLVLLAVINVQSGPKQQFSPTLFCNEKSSGVSRTYRAMNESQWTERQARNAWLSHSCINVWSSVDTTTHSWPWAN